MGGRRKKEQGREEGRKGRWEGGEERRRKELDREGRRKEQWRENLLSKGRMNSGTALY